MGAEGNTSMYNYVVFEDGHRERIFWYNESPGRVELTTQSGRYAYCETIVKHHTGFAHTIHKFYRYQGFVDCQNPAWVAIETIKNFVLTKRLNV